MTKKNRVLPPTLAEAGIDKKLSSRAQKLAAVPEDEFEGMIGEWREDAVDEKKRVPTKLLKPAARHLVSSGDSNIRYAGKKLRGLLKTRIKADYHQKK